MSCEDVSRLVDLREFSSLTDAERRDAAAHAQGCPRCLPLWSAHENVAAMPIPPLPPELVMRWRMQAAAGVRTAVQGAAPRRRMIVVVSLAALAAAAGMLLVNIADAPAPTVAIADATVATPAAPLSRDFPAPVSAVQPVGKAQPDAAALPRSVPLIPVPLDSDQAFIARRNLALQKLVELYPELVRGSPTEDSFVAYIVLRTDGAVLSHAMHAATRETSRRVTEELARLMPMDGGEPVLDIARKGTQLPDGSALRGNLSYRWLLVPVSYDPSRSNLRVEEILQAEGTPRTFPAIGPGLKYLTVLLSDDGTVQRENTELLDVQQLQERAQAGATARASDMARRLGVAVEQIGLMGFMPMREDANERQIYVEYAWQRRSSETAPAYRQAGDASAEEDVNTAWALALVEQVMPDAFMSGEVARSLGQPVVILTAKGELIRTGRRKPGQEMARLLEDLAPGLVSNSARTVILKNSRGEEAAVYFVWQESPTKQ